MHTHKLHHGKADAEESMHAKSAERDLTPQSGDIIANPKPIKMHILMLSLCISRAECFYH